MNKQETLKKVVNLLEKYRSGKLGDTTMPEESHPVFNNQEEKLIYFTLPMALNYQRNSYKLWESAKKTWEDENTKDVFNFEFVTNNSIENVREKLLKYKLGLQPNKHIDTWIKISKTIFSNWRTISSLINSCDNDFLKLKEIVQKEYKKGFPYLSGPKIFNYWSYILTQYCDIELKNRNCIEIAPDTHVIQASVKLGLIENNEIKREELSKIWRDILEGTGIDPIDIHSPLWFWSRGGFKE